MVGQTGRGGLARATFRNLGIGRMPPGWGNADVGGTGVPGATVYAPDGVSMQGGGSDLWGTRDAFHFMYTLRAGDGDVMARIDRLTVPVDASFAIAGVTMRESLSPGARHASMIVTTEGKAKFRRRVNVGGNTFSNGPSTGSTSIPRWVRLTWRGQNVTAYLSTDGLTWQKVHTTQLVAMPARLYVGIVALRNGGAGAARADFDR